MISRKRGDDIYIGVRPQKEIRKKQDADGNEILDRLSNAGIRCDLSRGRRLDTDVLQVRR